MFVLTLNIQHKSALFGLMTLVLVSSIPIAFSSTLGEDWKSIKSSLSDAEKSDAITESLSYVNDAHLTYINSFKNTALEVDSQSDTLIENAIDDIVTNHNNGDTEMASLNRQIIDKTIYKIAFMKMESSIKQNDSAEFLNWYDVMEKKFKISEKEYETNSLLSELQSDTSLLSTNGPAITTELLGIFKLKTIEELEEAIAALDEGDIKNTKKFTYEGLYYYRTLHPSVEERLGTETANELLHEMEESVEVSMSGKPASEMKAEMEHIFSEVELIIREYEGGNTSETGLALSGIKDRLNLVEAEYLDAVKDGKIIDQDEYDETIVFLVKATEIFNKNKPSFTKLSISDTTSLAKNFDELNQIVTAKDSPNQVSILVGKSINNISTLEDLAGGSIQIDTIEYIDEIERLLNEAKNEYRLGNTQLAFDLVSEAYLDNYEFVEGPLSEVDSDLMIKLELAIREDLRNMIKNNASTEEVEKQVSAILDDLNIVRDIMSDQQNPMLVYVDNIRNLLEKAKLQYSAGNVEEAKRLAMEAYIDNYEYLEDPVEEQNEELNDELEIMLREDLQALMRNNVPSSQVNDKINQILERMDTVAVIVPEFGTVALLVLFVAVTSIVILSRKSSLLTLNRM